MSTAELIAAAAEAFLRGLNEAAGVPEDDGIESEGHGADDIVALRQEWGYKLLAEQQKVEQLEFEREKLYEQLRQMTRTVQKVYKVFELLHEALYDRKPNG